MKVIKRFIWVLLLILCSTTLFVGCSDDDDNDGKKPPEVGDKIGPSTVFTGKRPESYAGSKVTYGKDGLVTKIVTEDEEVTFTYPSAITKATNAKQAVRMTVSYPGYPEEGKLYLDMTIGSNGYVESCKETYEMDTDIDTWEFGYNSDGQLNYMKRSENDNGKTRIIYENGDIIKIEEVSDIDSYSGTVNYGLIPIENKGCIMMFDTTFGIDMDEMKFAYLAGLLGKATKHLPISYTGTSSKDNSYELRFEWKLDSNSYPLAAILDGREYNFVWQ